MGFRDNITLRSLSFLIKNISTSFHTAQWDENLLQIDWRKLD